MASHLPPYKPEWLDNVMENVNIVYQEYILMELQVRLLIF